MQAIARNHADMPAALQTDWDLIREMFTNGVSLKEIEQETGVQTGTVSSRASRFKWKQTALKAKSIMQVDIPKVEPKQANEAKLEAASERTRQRLARFVERCSEKLEEMPLPTPKSAVIASQEAEALMRSAKTVFAWGEALAQPAIRIQVVAQCRLAKEPAGYVPSSVQAQDKSMLLAGAVPIEAEGGKPSLPVPVDVEVVPDNFSTFENASKPVEDYMI